MPVSNRTRKVIQLERAIRDAIAMVTEGWTEYDHTIVIDALVGVKLDCSTEHRQESRRG